MNKLLLNSEDTIDNLVIEDDTKLVLHTENKKKEIKIIVEKQIHLHVIDISFNSNINVTIELKENSSLTYNKVFKDNKDSLEIYLNGENSDANIKTSSVNVNNTTFNCIVRHNNKNTSSMLVNHGINLSTEELKFKIDAIISYNGNLSRTSQINKIINIKNGKSYILPNLIVDNDEVEANHSAYISDFNKDELFYMKSRGINEKKARELLIDAFLIGNLEHIDEYKEEIRAILK